MATWWKTNGARQCGNLTLFFRAHERVLRKQTSWPLRWKRYTLVGWSFSWELPLYPKAWERGAWRIRKEGQSLIAFCYLFCSVYFKVVIGDFFREFLCFVCSKSNGVHFLRVPMYKNKSMMKYLIGWFELYCTQLRLGAFACCPSLTCLFVTTLLAVALVNNRLLLAVMWAVVGSYK